MPRFFTSDQHFGHTNIIGYCNRPFSTTEEMDAALIANWNAIVTSDSDEVYTLGDFTCNGGLKRIAELCEQLRGIKHLIRGNHDRHNPREFIKAGFASCSQRLFLETEVRMHNNPVMLCLRHKPIREPEKRTHPHWIVNGHVHDRWTVRKDIKHINVGVDAFAFKPITEKRLVNIIERAEEASFNESMIKDIA